MEPQETAAGSAGFRRIISALGMVRRLWDGLGVVVLLLLIIGGVWAGVARLRRGQASVGAGSPAVASASWWAQFSAEYQQSLRMRWQPYVYWRRYPMTGQYVNVDSLGIRRTVTPWPPEPVRRTVLVFGGSTVWGTGQRDGFTVPSLIAEGLGGAGWTGVSVTNYGESGYVFTQEVLQLMLALRDGARPDLVVFYDGINDVAAGVMEGRGGLPQNESRRALEFDIGRLLSTRRLAELKTVLARASARVGVVDGLNPATGWTVSDSAAAAIATSVVDVYGRTAAVVEALAAAYGFRVLYFWQPSPGASRKPLTGFERTLVSDGGPPRFSHVVLPVARQAAGRVEPVMRRVAAERFHSLVGVFDDDSTDVWLDEIGHVTEAANRRIVQAMMPVILAQLGKPAERDRPLRGAP